MENARICPLCEQPAAISSVPGEGGKRFRVDCEAECPPYLITRRAGVELKRKPNRRTTVLAFVKSLHAKNPEDIPVVRMTNGSEDLIVVAKSKESWPHGDPLGESNRL